MNSSLPPTTRLPLQHEDKAQDSYLRPNQNLQFSRPYHLEHIMTHRSQGKQMKFMFYWVPHAVVFPSLLASTKKHAERSILKTNPLPG